MPQTKASQRPRSRTRALRLERRATLLQAADRVVRRDGAAATMTAMAAEAGVTKPILYKHFGSRGGLYQALAERYLDGLLAELRQTLLGGNNEDRIHKTIAAYVSFIDEERDAYSFLMHRAVSERTEAEATVTGFIRRLGDEIAMILREELERAGIDQRGAEPWAHGIVGMVYLAGDRWLESGDMTREQLIDHLSSLLWKGFSGLA